MVGLVLHDGSNVRCTITEKNKEALWTWYWARPYNGVAVHQSKPEHSYSRLFHRLAEARTPHVPTLLCLELFRNGSLTKGTVKFIV